MRLSFISYAILSFYSVIPAYAVQEYNAPALGGWAISVELFKYVRQHVPEGETVLELGSGSGTGELAKFYTMYSIENSAVWLDKYDTYYIYAPIRQYNGYRWYDIDKVVPELPSEYALIIIDGPTGQIGRYGFYHHLHHFNTEVPLVFDDVQRGAEMKLLKDVAHKLGRPYKVIKCADGKWFGVINHPV